MKALLRKTFCFIISILLFACPIYSNANYHNSLLEVHAEDNIYSSEQLGYILALWLAGMGINVITKSNDIGNWLNDKYLDFLRGVKNFNDATMERVEKLRQSQTFDDKGKIFEVPSELYNLYSDFVTYLKNENSIAPNYTATIGVSSINSYVTGTLSVSSRDAGYDNNYMYYYDLDGSRCGGYGLNHLYFYSYSNFTVTRYCIDRKGNKNSVHEMPAFRENDYYKTYDTSTYNNNPPFLTDIYPNVFLSSSDADNVLSWKDRILGNSNVLNFDVNADGTLNLDDRVVSTDEEGKLDMTKVKGFGVDTTLDTIYSEVKQWILADNWPTDFPLAEAKPIAVPEPTTEPLPTTEPIPTEQPDNPPFDGEITDYQTPSLTTVFPFCVPYDVIKFFGVLNAEPKAPKWTFDLNNISEGYKLTIDMKDYESIIVVFRYGMLGLFIIGLILITRYIVGGQ